MNKKASGFFSLYLVLLTLMMCGIVIGAYILQQDGIENSLVSPRAVLEVRDDLDLFELKEVELIKSSLESASGTFPDTEFIDSFRENFISGFMNDESMKNFILSDLTREGQDFSVEASQNFGNFLESGLYIPILTREENGRLVFARDYIGKAFLLEAEDKTKINFGVDFSFEFEREYLIGYDGNEYSVEAK